MPAESLRLRVARHVDPEAWAKHDRYRALVAARSEAGSRPWDSYEQDMLHSASGTVQPSLAKADAILSEILPLLREAGEGLEPFAKLTPSSLYPEDGSEAEGYRIFLAEPCEATFTGADLARLRAIHAKIMELIDAEG